MRYGIRMISNKNLLGEAEIGHFMLYFLNVKDYYLFNEVRKTTKTAGSRMGKADKEKRIWKEKPTMEQ